MNFIDAIRFVAVFDLNAVIMSANKWNYLTEEKIQTLKVIDGVTHFSTIEPHNRVMYSFNISRNKFHLLEVYFGTNIGERFISLVLDHASIKVRYGSIMNDDVCLHKFNSEPIGEDEFFQLSLIYNFYGFEYHDIQRLINFYNSTLCNLR